MSVEYPNDFIKRVQQEYNDCNTNLLDKYQLGQFLARGVDERISPEEVIKAFKSNNCVLILEKAQEIRRKRFLYKEWLKLVVEHIDILSGSINNVNFSFLRKRKHENLQK
jgi:hypothetical protein